MRYALQSVDKNRENVAKAKCVPLTICQRVGGLAVQVDRCQTGSLGVGSAASGNANRSVEFGSDSDGDVQIRFKISEHL